VALDIDSKPSEFHPANNPSDSAGNRWQKSVKSLERSDLTSMIDQSRTMFRFFTAMIIIHRVKIGRCESELDVAHPPNPSNRGD